jgi:hypothetical protein
LAVAIQRQAAAVAHRRTAVDRHTEVADRMAAVVAADMGGSSALEFFPTH